MVSLPGTDLGRLPVGWTRLRGDRSGGRSPVACGERAGTFAPGTAGVLSVRLIGPDVAGLWSARVLRLAACAIGIFGWSSVLAWMVRFVRLGALPGVHGVDCDPR